MKKSVFSLILSILLFSCSDSENGERNKNMLPESMGAQGELFVVMDSTQWRGGLGEKIREIFMAEIEGLPREEYEYTIRYVQPGRMTSSLKTVGNLIYVATLDSETSSSRIVRQQFSDASIEKIKSDNRFFISAQEDLYARGQTVLYLFGNTEADLINNLEENQTQILDMLKKKNRERISKAIFERRSRGIEKSILDQFGIRMKIPENYQVALFNEEFIWIRQVDQDIDKNIFIYQTPYYDVSQFENYKVIERRDKVGRKYIYEDRDLHPDSYVITETDVPFRPVITKQINLNNRYAVVTRGLWRTNNKSMGGPFLGITTVNEVTNRLIYAEAFVFSPGEPQRDTMRELETVLYTMETPESPRETPSEN